jgi:hypothetical protein
MAFTEKYLPVAKQRYFTFFASDGDAAAAWNDTMDEQFSPDFAFILDKVRLHLSTVHVSVVSFVVTVSHHIDSAYNEILISQAMNGVKDVVYQADPNRYFHQGDTLSCAMAMSAANVYGLEISGWAITVPARS